MLGKMNMLHIVCIMLVLVHQLNGRCAEGCLKCLGNNVCSICDASSLYVMINGECVKQNLEFCLYTFNLNSCLVCYPGFYLEISGKCVKNPEGVNQIENCKEYESYTRCRTCYQYYFLTDEGRQCEKVENNPIENCIVYESNSTCKVCGDYVISSDGTRCDIPQIEDKKCMFYSDKTYCAECQDEYYLDKNFYIRHIEDFYQYIFQARFKYYINQHSLINIPVCEKKTLIQNCLIPSGNHKCELCKDGYYVNESKNECIEDPLPTVFFRTTNITNCYLHNNTMVTRNNVLVENIECILCYEGYYKAVNNRKCMAHSNHVNNCKIMSQSVDLECLVCNEGYYRQNDPDPNSDEKCMKRVDTNEYCEIYHALSEACEECVDATYIKHYEEKFCSPPIEFCKLYETSGQILSCRQCDFGYYYKVESGQCLKNDVFDPYCAFYNEQQVCQECYFGFYYDESTDSPLCQPNSAEYVDRARCDGFHPLNYNECIECLGNKTILNVLNTCKMFRPNIDSEYSKYSVVTYCNSYTMTKGEEFKCLEPIPEVQDDNEDNKKLYVLYTNIEKAYDKTSSKILYCDKHHTVYDNTSMDITCEKCYDIRYITTDFEYSNINETENCLEEEIDSGYCVKYLSEYSQCREYTYYNYNRDTCPNGYKACYRVCVFGCFTICGDECPYCPWKCDGSSEITWNTCAGHGWNDDHCNSKDSFGNCNIFHFFQYGIGVKFKEDIPYEIVISPDKKNCLPYDSRQFENNGNCIQNTADGKTCILCKKGFYSIPYRVYTYEKDSIESYVSKINVEDFVDKCIRFNNITKICSRCAPGYFLSRNTCMTCNDRNIAISPDGITCVQFVDENFEDRCNKIGLIGTLNYCVECKSDYVADINWDVSTVSTISFFPKIDDFQTMIELQAETLVVKNCIDNNDLFYYEENIKDSIQNCLFYEVYDEVTYCMGCKFGFTGTVYRTPNNFLTVQDCKVDDECNTGTTYPLKDPFISTLVTCHSCVDTSKIPTYVFFYTTFIDVSKAEFIYESTVHDKKTMFCDTPQVSNCLIQFTTNDPLVQSKWGGSSTVCTYCKPMYHPTYQSTLDDFFPYQIITSCDSIPYCESSLIPGECESCNADINDPLFNDRNLVEGGGIDSCQYNEYTGQDPLCKKTLSTSSSGTCDECKDGSVYLDFKCITLNITSCKYFRGSSCVDADKELDENKSLIWTEYNSEYQVEQINCVEVSEGIENCEYYISETECHQCAPGYAIGLEGKFCFQANINQCESYDTSTGICSKCASNYDLTSAGICIPVTNPPNFRGCEEYSDGVCTKCTDEGFHPIYINANKTNICINSTVVEFCEEIDEQMLLINKTLSCSKCKTIKSYEGLSTTDDFEINNFDFYVIGSPEYASDNDLKKASQIWDHYSSLDSYIKSIGSYDQDIRFALFKYDYDVCHEFAPVLNCLRYDDHTFENTFDCIECEFAFFLNNGSCVARTIIPFCTEYYIDQNDCKIYVDTWNYSIQYSTFDLFVISNVPPALEPVEYPIEGIEGCISYWDLNTCKYCNNTTYLYDNLCLTVNVIVPDCEIYSREGLCKQCKGDLLLFQNKCLNKYSSNCTEYLSNTSCGQCSLTYPFISQGSCMKNPDVVNCETYANKELCLKCDDNYFRNQNGLCTLRNNYILNCKKHLEGPFCSECIDGYTLINNECILNPNYDRYCKSFGTTSNCQICEFNHYFKLGQCYECLTDSFSCYFCDPDNPSSCLLCKSGFFMNNEKECVVMPDFTQPLIKLYQESVSSKFISIRNTMILSLHLLLLFI